MPATNIVIIGAGSASFGASTLATIIRSQPLKGSQLGLVDLDAANLQHVACTAERMNQTWDAHMTIRASTDRRDLLPGANFVIVSIEVPPREVLWRLDWEIPTRHGLRQPYGENGGPGGLMHACRQIPPIMAIVRDMEELCPAAWLINFSNPLPRITRAITKYSGIKTVGKCHQIDVGYGLAAFLLADEYGLEVPAAADLHSDPANYPYIHLLATAGHQQFRIKAAGLNHFTWIMDIRDRQTGQDLYPALRAANESRPRRNNFEPLSRDLFSFFGYCPVPGDTHLCEYLPWTHDPTAKPWEHYNLRLYDWGGNEAYRLYSQQLMAQMAAGTTSVEGMRDAHSEGAVELIEAISGNTNYYDQAVNVSNAGAIPNLPAETIVELPAIAAGSGIHPLTMPPLPTPIAELCRREAALVELVVDAAVTGDRTLALQALLLDPMINDIPRARALLDDYLTTFADYLPQFQN
jgi:alpha-galactosidase